MWNGWNARPLTGFDTGPAIKFRNQAQFHPLQYLRALAAAIERYGGRIYTGTRVVDVQESEHGIAKTQDGLTIHAQCVRRRDEHAD